MNTRQRTANARRQHWPAAVPDAVWAPLAAGLLMLAVGMVGLLAHEPWIFPSLGPTAFLQAETPESKSARFYNTVVGHLLGLGAGLAAVFLLGADQAPAVLSSHDLTGTRLWAAVLAVALTLFLGYLLRASHPPAAATTLLVALGSLKPDWETVQTVIVGVLILAFLGDLLRRVRIGEWPLRAARD